MDWPDRRVCCVDGVSRKRRCSDTFKSGDFKKTVSRRVVSRAVRLVVGSSSCPQPGRGEGGHGTGYGGGRRGVARADRSALTPPCVIMSSGGASHGGMACRNSSLLYVGRAPCWPGRGPSGI